jgi:dipeptidyl-peptidase-4
MKTHVSRNESPFGGRRSATLAVLIGILLASAAAQDRPANRASYELAQKFSLENVKKMVFDLNAAPEWLGGSDVFWYRWTTSRGSDFYLVDCARRKIEPVFDRTVLAGKLSRLTGQPVEPAALGIEQLIFPKDSRSVQFAAAGAIWELDRASGNLRRLPDSELADEKSAFNAAQMKVIRDYTGGGTLRGATLFSPDDRWGVFARDHNLFVTDARDPEKREYQLTKDGEPWYGYDSSGDDDAALKGEKQFVFVTWFPDSKRFFLKRTDMRQVRDMYLLQPLARPVPTLKRYKNTLAGDEYAAQYELWVFDCEKKAGLKIAADRWVDQQIGGKAADGGVYPLFGTDKLLFIRTDRTWTRTDLAEADLKTGKVRTLIDEELHPNITPTSAQVRILGQGREIIWWSDRDGWGHFYLYDGNGVLKNRITSGAFCARSVVRVDEIRRTLVFTASGLEPGIDP